MSVGEVACVSLAVGRVRVARSGVVRELGVMASMPGVEASSGVRLGLLVARSSLQLGVRFI